MARDARGHFLFTNRQEDEDGKEEGGRKAMPFAIGAETMYRQPGVRIPVAGPAEQAAMAAGMAGQTMDNIRRENDSRVSQRREMRRMAHEQELMRMKMQGEAARANADREAMLIRELLSGM